MWSRMACFDLANDVATVAEWPVMTLPQRATARTRPEPSIRTEVSIEALAELIGPVRGLPTPLYAGIAARIRGALSDGTLPPGARLPAERDLAATLLTSRVTISSAYRVLREQGWASARHGAGTFTSASHSPHQEWLPRAGEGFRELAHAAPQAPPELFPAYQRALARMPGILSGHGYNADGLPALRDRIAQRFTSRGLPTEADQILVTAGTGDAAAIAFDHLVGPGDRILLEHPTYPGAVESVIARGGQPVPVPTDAADPDGLVARAGRSARQSAPRAAYLMPDFANPTGAQLSGSGRKRLAATLWQQGVVTIVDEVCAELDLSGADPVKPYAAGVPDAATITVGGLAKAVWGGLRIGWLRTDAALAGHLAQSFGRRQLTVSAMEQLVAVELFDIFDDILVGHRARLRAQRDVLAAALREQVPQWRFRVPDGGLSLWCELPAGLSSTVLANEAASRGLHLATGTLFGTGHAFDDHLRLPFTLPEADLRAAVEVLAGLAEELAMRPSSAAPASPLRVV